MKQVSCPVVLLLAILSVCPLAGEPKPTPSADAIDIQTAHGTSAETQTRMVLQALLRKYDLAKYTFTDKSSSSKVR